MELSGAIATNGALGAGAATATDLLTPKIGTVKAGGVAGGAVEAMVSTVQNADDFASGKIDGASATANVIVDTSVAMASGSAGAAVGATVGSIVPVGGTAIGAATGFAVGVGVHYAIQAVGQMTGALDAAKTRLASGLSEFEVPLAHSWESISSGIENAKASATLAINTLKING